MLLLPTVKEQFEAHLGRRAVAWNIAALETRLDGHEELVQLLGVDDGEERVADRVDRNGIKVGAGWQAWKGCTLHGGQPRPCGWQAEGSWHEGSELLWRRFGGQRLDNGRQRGLHHCKVQGGDAGHTGDVVCDRLVGSTTRRLFVLLA